MKEIAVFGRNLLVAPSWGMTLLRGILLILVGVMLINNSGLALSALTWAVGLICCVGAVGAFIQALNAKAYRELLIFYSVLIFLFGVVVMTVPIAANFIIMFTFAFWLLIGGGLQLYHALFKMPSGTSLRLFALISSGLSMVVGFFLLFNPLMGMEIVATILGVFLLFYGAFLCMFSSMLYKGGK